MNVAQLRQLVAKLPGTWEAPHHDRLSFRVGTRIFATLKEDDGSLNILLPEEAARGRLRADASLAPVTWGKRLAGVGVALAEVSVGGIEGPLEEAWEIAAPEDVREIGSGRHRAMDELRRKLPTRAAERVGVRGAPPDLMRAFGPCAPPAQADVVVDFVATAKAVPAALKRCAGVLARGDRAWLAYPKGQGASSGLSRDVLRESASNHGLETVRLIAVDSTWSALRLEPR
jgi:hypothetical protein